MSDFIICVDSSCDMSINDCNEIGVIPIKIKYQINDEIFEDSMEVKEQIEFYQKMRDGAVPKTSQINITEFVDFWNELLKEGKPIIQLVLGSEISGTYNNAVNAKKIILENNPFADITVIDTTGASCVMAVLANGAAQMREDGKSKSEVIDWLEKTKHNVQAVYTTNDLVYLHRGGRLSKGGLIIAGTLGIKPVLKLNFNGGLYTANKVRGKEAIKKKLAEEISDSVIEPEKQYLYVAHADGETYADECLSEILKLSKFKGIKKSYIGATIGAHAGPGLVAYFYVGKTRE